MSDDVLDDYVEPSRQGGLTPKHVYENSGHKMLCSTCKKFQRTSADWAEGPVLRVTCKVCKTYVDFVVTDAGLVPKWFDAHVRSFTMGRARGLLQRKG
jgi:hypothetical protein